MLNDELLYLLATEFQHRTRPLVGVGEAPVDVALELLVRVDAAAAAGLPPDAYVVRRVDVGVATLRGTCVEVHGLRHPIVVTPGGRRAIRWWRGSPLTPSVEVMAEVDSAVDPLINRASGGGG